jgi:hypothetical protein
LQAPIRPVATFGTILGVAPPKELKPSPALVENRPGVQPAVELEVDVGRAAGFGAEQQVPWATPCTTHFASAAAAPACTPPRGRIAWAAEACPLAAHMCQQGLAETS